MLFLTKLTLGSKSPGRGVRMTVEIYTDTEIIMYTYASRSHRAGSREHPYYDPRDDKSSKLTQTVFLILIEVKREKKLATLRQHSRETYTGSNKAIAKVTVNEREHQGKHTRCRRNKLKQRAVS